MPAMRAPRVQVSMCCPSPASAPPPSILLMWPLCEPWVMLPSGHPGCEWGCHVD